MSEENVVSLFPHTVAKPNTTEPYDLFLEMKTDAIGADKALVILINDRAGVWETKWGSSNMDNSEAMLALEVLKDLILSAVKGR